MGSKKKNTIKYYQVSIAVWVKPNHQLHQLSPFSRPQPKVPPLCHFNFIPSLSGGLGMGTLGSRRLMKDFERLQKDPPTGISVALQDDDITRWSAVILGPVDSPWDGGRFKLVLQFPSDHPFKPPKVRFVSRMFHPNIYADGSICLDVLQENWSPALHVPQVLVSIQSLLCDPNPNSPVNSEAARMFIENKREYNLKIREIVEHSCIAADE